MLATGNYRQQNLVWSVHVLRLRLLRLGRYQNHYYKNISKKVFLIKFQHLFVINMDSAVINWFLNQKSFAMWIYIIYRD